MAENGQIQGLDRLREVLQALADRPDDVRDVLREHAQEAEATSVEYTPKDTGALRASHNVEDTPTGAQISVGGPAAPYAVYVHESTHRRWQEPGTGAKFLERAVAEQLPEITRDLERLMDPDS